MTGQNKTQIFEIEPRDPLRLVLPHEEAPKDPGGAAGRARSTLRNLVRQLAHYAAQDIGGPSEEADSREEKLAQGQRPGGRLFHRVNVKGIVTELKNDLHASKAARESADLRGRVDDTMQLLS